jgi:hypothetical protein
MINEIALTQISEVSMGGSMLSFLTRDANIFLESVNGQQGPVLENDDNKDVLGSVSESMLPQLETNSNEEKLLLQALNGEQLMKNNNLTDGSLLTTSLSLPRELQNPPILSFGEMQPVPVQEYLTEGYIAKAFPNLFLFGNADLKDQSRRLQPVPTADYFKHRLFYQDGRFAQDPRLIFFALNTRLRWQLNDLSLLSFTIISD